MTKACAIVRICTADAAGCGGGGGKKKGGGGGNNTTMPRTASGEAWRDGKEAQKEMRGGFAECLFVRPVPRTPPPQVLQGPKGGFVESLKILVVVLLVFFLSSKSSAGVGGGGVIVDPGLDAAASPAAAHRGSP